MLDDSEVSVILDLRSDLVMRVRGDKERSPWGMRSAEVGLGGTIKSSKTSSWSDCDEGGKIMECWSGSDRFTVSELASQSSDTLSWDSSSGLSLLWEVLVVP